MYKILIVEDDPIISQLVAETLTKWQLEPIKVTEFEKVMEIFEEKKADLVLMDINLPVCDGFYWNQKIREVSQVPIIFISSRNANMDMVMAMNMGADDYVPKPFSTEVLMAKINALLRRSYNYTEQNNEELVHNDVTLNLANGAVTFDNKTIELSKNEYKLLQFLMRQHGQIVSRESLLRALWEDERFVDDNTLTVNINRLRKRFDEIGLHDFIETKVGQGYLIP